MGTAGSRDPMAGAQALRRGLEVLRVLASQPGAGLTLQEVTQATGLRRSTAHRLLASLVEEEFATREAGSHRYLLGAEVMRLGLASVQRPPLVARYLSTLKLLARLSGETVLLMVRIGDHCMCVHREEGPNPARILRARVGEMWPLGVGAGGMAILSTLPREEALAIHDRQATAFEAAGLSRAQVLRMMERGQRDGYVAMIDTVTRGVGGVAAVVPHAPPFAAMAIADLRRNVSTARRADLGDLLLRTLGARPR